ncbi:phage tail tube protein [Achromobacter xylosoxidans]
MAGTTVSQFVQTQGTQLEVSTTATEDLGAAGLAYADLAITIKDPNFQGGQTTEIDVTVLKSTAKEYALGLDDSGTFSMAGNWKAGDPAQKALVAARSDKKTRAFRVTFADGAKFEFLGLVTQYQWQGQLDNVMSATFNVRVTGAVKMTDAPANGAERHDGHVDQFPGSRGGRARPGGRSAGRLRA